MSLSSTALSILCLLLLLPCVVAAADFNPLPWPPSMLYTHTGLALVCCATAMLLPYVTDLMAFVGALLTMTISLILPALMHLQLFKQEAPAGLLLLDCFVVMLGVLCAYVGATSAMTNLQQKLAACPVV